jgi:quercetin dioxygenase-like cupin family protein
MTNAVPPEARADATFRHLDDIEWTPVQQQRNADGSVSVVREKWPIIRPGFLSAYVHYEPGMVVRRHGHRSNHIVIVLDGGVHLGDRWCTAGTHVHVPLGAAFGPIVAGPEGVTCWELSFGEFGGWGDQPELYQHEIETRGVTPLPDPPLDLGDWFHDPRGDWGAERASPRVDGLLEVFTNLDDLPWTDVKRAQRADGTVAAVRVRRPIAQPDFVSASTEYDAGMVVRRHRHAGHHLVLVLEGGAWFGDHWCPAGTHVELPPGVACGPIVAGDQGVRMLEMTDGDIRTSGDQRERFDDALATHGLTPLPDPPLDAGTWFVDTRGEWAAGESPDVT